MLSTSTLRVLAVLILSVSLLYKIFISSKIREIKVKEVRTTQEVNHELNKGDTPEIDSLALLKILSNEIKTQDVFSDTINQGDDQCFCQLQGAIDDCACHIETIDSFNNNKIFPRLQSLLAQDYFRYVQVNLKKLCPFWSDDSQCAFEFCQVKECRDEEVPIGLKGQSPHPLKPKTRPKKSTCGEDLGFINTTISEESQEGFERWKAYDNSLVDFCSVSDEDESDLEYVDLLLNPERFTGYAGPSAHRVWKSIYLENCFEQSISSLIAPFNKENIDESCIEKRTFYRAISGLHASINIHLSSKYLLQDGKNSALFKIKEGLWGPNLTEFRQHFDMKTTNGQGPAWLKNLYFLYLIELRAIWKLSNYLKSFNFYTGNDERDSDVAKAVQDLIKVIESFPSHFEESALFSRNDAPKLRIDFHQRFTNISRIMDCVGCQKCKLWGKIQIRGLGTALKILFSEPFNQKKIANVSRNEIVALINSFGRLSNSIVELERFRKLMENSHTVNQYHRGSDSLFKT